MFVINKIKKIKKNKKKNLFYKSITYTYNPNVSVCHQAILIENTVKIKYSQRLRTQIIRIWS